MSINRAIISGNLTRDAELRSTASGTPVMQFGVAVNDRVKNGASGEWEDRPNFIDCTMFGARAEKIAQYLSKGSKVTVEGKLRWSQWEKDGEKRSKLEVVVDEIEFLSRSEAAPSENPSSYPSQAQAPSQSQPRGLYDEDIAF